MLEDAYKENYLSGAFLLLWTFKEWFIATSSEIALKPVYPCVDSETYKLGFNVAEWFQTSFKHL